MINELIQNLAAQQKEAKDKNYLDGIFASTRLHPLIPYSREDENIFFSSAIIFNLQEYYHLLPKDSQIIERFEQLGLERWKIAQTLKAACAQRLLKILCNECKVLKKGLSDDEIELFSLDSKFKTMDVYEASKVGCRECGHCGYGGRAAILEIIPITPQLGDALSKGTITPYEVELQIAKEGKLPNLRKTGLEYFERGLTDLDSLKKVIDLSH